MKTIDYLRIINHSYWNDLHELRYHQSVIDPINIKVISNPLVCWLNQHFVHVDRNRDNNNATFLSPAHAPPVHAASSLSRPGSVVGSWRYTHIIHCIYIYSVYIYCTVYIYYSIYIYCTVYIYILYSIYIYIVQYIYNVYIPNTSTSSFNLDPAQHRAFTLFHSYLML